ncbi:hypothetical protein [Halomonas sp. DN3]|uniref:hypothetical protein n=1 Tax=Halomonas sp. DN3 TaxID=2953657 RepID=UPI00209EDE1F|nr:hypothetical protein [Halomonas sp. DN3]USZ49358.1 hypothetical protein NKF27_18000 [Halomonas sp. DN3]
MQEMVEQIHSSMWSFCQKARIDVDPVMLKRSIGQQVSGALLVVSPEALKRIGHSRLAVMIDVANRHDLSLAELLNEALVAGADDAASVCRSLHTRKEHIQKIKMRSRLTLVRPTGPPLA